MATESSDYTIARERPESLSAYWRNQPSSLAWNCFFVLPSFLEVWCREFGAGAKLYPCVVRHKGAVIGIAPLCLREEEACFLGSPDVSDCLDFVVAPGNERGFFNILLEDLIGKGIKRLCLSPLRPDSTVLVHLVEVARGRGHTVSCRALDVSLELNLPPTWEDYLGMLNRKQRHEVRRKLRRLQEKGAVTYRTIEKADDAAAAVPLFLELFQKSTGEKSGFMTTRMVSFFTSLVEATARANLLKMGVLDLNAHTVAMLLCFDYDDTLYLYNNGYDPAYRSMSVGFISKVLSIKDSIERGRKKFDFLKGGEAYKYRLGGKAVFLHECEVLLK